MNITIQQIIIIILIIQFTKQNLQFHLIQHPSSRSSMSEEGDGGTKYSLENTSFVKAKCWLKLVAKIGFLIRSLFEIIDLNMF